MMCEDEKIVAYGVRDKYKDNKITLIKIFRALYKERMGYSIGLKEAKVVIDRLYMGDGVVVFYPTGELFAAVVKEFFITTRDRDYVIASVG